MSNTIYELMRFQSDRGLDKKHYNDLNEHVNIVEELIESRDYNVPKENRNRLAAALGFFMSDLVNKDIAIRTDNTVTDEDKVDAYGDIIVFAIGAIMKLGYNPNEVLVEVGKEINSREGEMVDGKFEKYLDDVHRAKWYKADFTKCKL